MTTAPVLLLGFNRPDKMRLVLDRVRGARPRHLYLAVDGPRPGQATDGARTAEVLALAREVDWLCEVEVLAQPTNLGCGRGVAAGISWFFASEPSGIVLEDDCVPTPSFFTYCSELLARHADDETVWMISGANLVGRWRAEEGTHFRSEGGAWGWASWADRWQYYDASMPGWPETGPARLQEALGGAFTSEMLAGFEGTARGSIDTWDYQWSWARLRHGGCTLVPTRNLVTNIGAGADSTHAFQDADLFVGMPGEELPASLQECPGAGMDTSYLDAVAAKMARNRRLLRRRSLVHRVRRLLPGRHA